MDKSLKIALGSLGVSLVVLAVKFTAYLITGSLALYSDALESIINVAPSIAAIIAGNLHRFRSGGFRDYERFAGS